MPRNDILLDTSILVDLFRGSAAAQGWIDHLPSEARFISIITCAELIAGCRNRIEQRKLERELDQYTTILIDEETSQIAFDLYKKFHLSGGACFFDCLIAASAHKYSLKIATLNVKHFKSFPGISAERPY